MIVIHIHVAAMLRASLDVLAEARRPSGFLTPTSDNSLNTDNAAASESKKRKREGDATMEDLLKEPFVVKVRDCTSPLEGRRKADILDSHTPPPSSSNPALYSP